MRPNKQTLLHLLVFFLLSLTPFFSWFNKGLNYQMIGRGDFVSILNPRKELAESMYAYDSNKFNGYGNSFLSSKIFPAYLLFSLLDYFAISPAVSTLVYLSLVLFGSQIFMYIYLMNKDSLVQLNAKYAFMGGLLYGSSPFILPTLNPGHLMALVIYASFPLILLLTIKVFKEHRYNAKLILLLFFTFLFSAASFGNIGNIYVLALILFAFTTCYNFIVLKRNISHYLKKSAWVTFTAFFALSWFLIPSIKDLTDIYAFNVDSSLTTFENLQVATSSSSLVNNLLGNPFYNDPDGVINGALYYPLIALGMLVLLAASAYLLVTVQKQELLLITILLLISLLISKGLNPPLQAIFYNLYEHLPGFKIFRRPASKIYGVFLFFFINLAVISFYTFETKMKRNLSLLVFVVTMLFVTSFVRMRPKMIMFNMPTYYNELSTYLKTTDPGTIYLYPGYSDSWSVVLDKHYNYYSGSDFLPYLLDESLIYHDDDDSLPNFAHRALVASIEDKILMGVSICDEAQKLNLTNILVDNNSAHSTDKITAFKNALESNLAVSSVKTFSSGGTSSTLYEISQSCYLGQVLVDGFSLSFENRTPVSYFFKLHGTDKTKPLEIALLKNYSKNWRLYKLTQEQFLFLAKNPSSLAFFTFKNLSAALRSEQSGHMNLWEVDSENSGDSYFLLYNVNQNLLYLGIIFSLFFIFINFLIIRRKPI